MKKIFNAVAKGLAAKFPAWTIIGLCFSCNHGRPCFNLKLSYDLLTLNLIGEPYGATDINAVSGNQGLSVAFNSEGTITVFKWPNPSFYDQVKYMTTERDSKRLGALANEGVFAGIYFEADSGNGFFPGHFGEIRIKRGEKVVAGQAQPQLWHHALFYLTAIEAFGKEDPVSK